MEDSCVYCLLVGPGFSLVYCSYESVARDLCRKQIYYSRQSEWCKLISISFPESYWI